MKLRVVKCELPRNRGKWKIERYSWLWGWEDFGGDIFDTFDEALRSATAAKTLL